MDAYSKALSLLAMREHGRNELEDKLVKKGYAREDVSLALDRLADEGYQSDKRFCESYIRSRLRKTPEGPSILSLRLQEKGIPSSFASRAVFDYFEEHDDEIKRIYNDYSSKIIASKGVEKGRVFLMRKGIRLKGVDYDE